MKEIDLGPIDEDPTNNEDAFALSEDFYGLDRRERERLFDDFESLVDMAGE